MPLRPRRRTRPLRPALGIGLVLGLLVGASQAGFTQARPAPPQSVRVAKGDTLWALAGRYRVSMQQLAASNAMKLSDVLLAGRMLQLPGQVGRGGRSTAPVNPDAGATSPAKRAAMRTFCTTYQPPTGVRRQLPGLLAARPDRLALRPVFVRWASAYHVPPDLLQAVAWQESGWQNDVVSSADARGIGQLLPQTADFVNHSLLGTNLKLTVAADNIRMAAAFLGFLLRGTGGQVCGAVAAYYQGLGTLHRVGVLPVSQIYVRGVLGLRPRFA